MELRTKIFYPISTLLFTMFGHCSRFNLRSRLFCDQFDGHIRGKVESTLIEPYKGMNDFSASSLAANAMMLHVSMTTLLHYTVCPKKWQHKNVWLWWVQTCTGLHIIKLAQALMYLDYCHQILYDYESIVPFNRFYYTLSKSSVTSSTTVCACFLCALSLTVLCKRLVLFKVSAFFADTVM